MKLSSERVLELMPTHGMIVSVGIARREAFQAAVATAHSVDDLRDILRDLIERLPDYLFQQQ